MTSYFQHQLSDPPVEVDRLGRVVTAPTIDGNNCHHLDHHRILTRLSDALRQATILARQLDAIATEQAALKTAGLTDETPYWRDGKYLVMISPMRHGQRRRRYVGSKPEAVRAELDRVDRSRRWETLEGERQRLTAALDQLDKKW